MGQKGLLESLLWKSIYLGKLLMKGHKDEQYENDEGDQRNHHIGKDSSAFRRAAHLPISMLFPLGWYDFFWMLQIRGKFGRAGIALCGVPFQSSINDLLHFSRNFGIRFARRNGMVKNPAVHNCKRVRALERHFTG